MANYEALYKGSTYLLDPNYHFTGFRIPFGELGGTTSIQTANQLKEVNNLLNQGMKVTEVSIVQPEVFEMIPKEQLKEINRLNKLTGAESTMHAPVIDPSGFTQEGWSEENRLMVQKQFQNIVERSHDVNPDGNIPVTIHSSQIPGSEMIPGKGPYEYLLTEEEKAKRPEQVLGKMIAVDRDSGKLIPLEREKRFYPGKPEGEIYTPDKEIKSANATHWDNQLSQLLFYKERADQLIKEPYLTISTMTKGDLTPENIAKLPEDVQKQVNAAKTQIQTAQIYYDQTQQSLNSLFNQAYKYSDEKGQEMLRKIADHYKNDLNQAVVRDRGEGYMGIYATALGNMILGIKELAQEKPPEKYVPVEQFAKDKASETLSNVAISSYNKFHDSSPILSIENPPYGGALSSGKDLKELVIETRNKFADKLVKEEGKSKAEAEKIAENLIGATWDTSHISMIRKQGFDRDKIVKETKEIAPFVKHVHFNDNFGTTHTDLPPGMGDVPIKDVMNELKKEGFEGKKIFEGGNFVQNFQTSPFPYLIEGTGSPLYMSGISPYWNQLGGSGQYFTGHGPINPPMHHQLYGASFTTLPVELGGEMQGQQSRFAGTPNT